jgi:probable HAF family extracellular repeat protein
VWQSPSAGSCRVVLPALGGGTLAHTVNGNGTIVGGAASLSLNSEPVPARWTLSATGWEVQALDGRTGGARGANATGDLAGYVTEVPCTQRLGNCSHAMVWYAAGQAFDLGTLGSDYNAASDINSAGEVVGFNATDRGQSTAFIWSPGVGVRLLPDKVTDAGANAVSEVRGDGTRVAAGVAGAKAVVWVIR